jgi:hypothetical protein
MELSAAPQLGLTIDGHLTACDQELGLSSARGDTSKLQHLAKADTVAGDFDQSRHTESISRQIRRPSKSCPSSGGVGIVRSKLVGCEIR